MRQHPSLIAVTGGLGFIGKYMIKRCLADGHFVVNIDQVNYASDRIANDEFSQSKNYKHIRQDVARLEYMPECDFLVNFAAESHVDNSIANSDKFCHSNVLGVQKLLELTRYKHASGAPLFIQISTDEVYGDILRGSHKETDILNPSNPYSATKAAADMLVVGWARTYGLRYNIIRMTNNYGLNQYPEKLIPKSASRMARGIPALLHGDGSFIRSWLHVEDTVEAILTIMFHGETNQIYNVHGSQELTNKEVLLKIAAILEIPNELAYVSIPNRVGQDVRYSLDDSKIRSLGWAPTKDFDQELTEIVTQFDFSRFL